MHEYESTSVQPLGRFGASLLLPVRHGKKETDFHKAESYHEEKVTGLYEEVYE